MTFVSKTARSLALLFSRFFTFTPGFYQAIHGAGFFNGGGASIAAAGFKELVKISAKTDFIF